MLRKGSVMTQRTAEAASSFAGPVEMYEEGDPAGELLAATRELVEQADRTLDYRPEFRRAIANAHAACVAMGALS